MSGKGSEDNDQGQQQPTGTQQLEEEQIAQLQQQVQQTKPENLTPQMLSQLFGITTETAAQIIQELPQLCELANTPTEQQFEQAVGNVQQPQLNSFDQGEENTQILEELGITEEEIEILELASEIGFKIAKKIREENPEEPSEEELLLSGIAAQTEQFDEIMSMDFVSDEERKMCENITDEDMALILYAASEMDAYTPYIIARNDWENVPWPDYIRTDQIPILKFILRQLLPRARTALGEIPQKGFQPEEPEQPLQLPGFNPNRFLAPGIPRFTRGFASRFLRQPQQQVQQQPQIRRFNRAPQGIPIPKRTATPARRRIRLPFGNSTDETDKETYMDEITVDIIDNSILIEDGKLTADTVMTAAMVQKYGDKSILKDPAELQKACDAWKVGLPITNRHPSVGVVMNQDEIVGWTTPPAWDDSNQKVRCSIEITDGATIKAIEDGKTDVSIGFYADEDKTEGKFGDDPYQSVQRNIVFNHLAVGIDRGNGRCPNGICGIEADCEYDIKTDCPYRDLEQIPDEFEIHCHVCDKTTKTKERADLKTIPCPDCGSGTTRSKKTDNENCNCCDHYNELTKDMKNDAKLTAAQRKALAAGTFCGPDRSFPIPDCAHYTAGLRLLGVYKGPGDKATIRNCIIRKGKGMSCPGAEKMDIDKDAEDAAILARTITNVEGLKGTAPGTYELLPGRPDTHNHFAKLDKDGNGKSSVNDEHSHKIVNFNVELANGHSHQLAAGTKPQEEPPMSDSEENKTNTGDNRQTTESTGGEKQKTDAEKALEEKTTKLIDSIMDMTPPFERDHFEAKGLDELEADFKLLQSQQNADNIPGKSGSNAGTSIRDEIDDEYGKLERTLKTR